MLLEVASELKNRGYVGIPVENLESFISNFSITTLDEKALKLLEEFFQDYKIDEFNVSSAESSSQEVMTQILEQVKKEAQELVELYKDAPKIKQEYVFGEIQKVQESNTQLEKIDSWFDKSFSLSNVILEHKKESRDLINLFFLAGLFIVILTALGVQKSDYARQIKIIESATIERSSSNQ